MNKRVVLNCSRPQKDKFNVHALKRVWLRGVWLIASLICSCSTFAQQIQDDYYKNLSFSAVSAAAIYYSLYEECLKTENNSGVCEETGKPRLPENRPPVKALRDKFVMSYRTLYSSQKLVVPSGKFALEKAREIFDYETVYLQRKLIIFMARVEMDCGNPKAYDAFKDIGRSTMKYYTLDILMAIDGLKHTKLDDPVFDVYEGSISSIYKNKQQCDFFLKKNQPIYINAYSNHHEVIKKFPYAERSLTYFISTLTDELLVMEK